MTTKNIRRKDGSGRVLKDGERPKGRGYEFRWSDRFGKRHSIFAMTLSELREKEEQLVRKAELEVTNDVRKMTLNSLYALWRKVKRGIKQNTFQNYQYMYESYAMNEIGNMHVMELKKTDIKHFYNRLYDNGLKPSTIDSVHTVIHQVLEMAVEDDIIRFNPADKALKELKTEHSRELRRVKALTVEEEVLFATYLYNNETARKWYPIFIVMMMAGLRLGEVTGLQWSDIDYENSMINVDKTLVYYEDRSERKCRHAMNTTKTLAGTRKVQMIDMVKEAFQMEKDMQEAAGLKCLSNVDGYDDFVFLNRFGCVHNHTTLNKALNRIVKECNETIMAESNSDDPLLLPKIHCHMLRHTFGTRLNDAGVNVKAMQTMMGHSDLKTTMQIYVDASSNLMSNAAGNYEEMISKMFTGRYEQQQENKAE